MTGLALDEAGTTDRVSHHMLTAVVRIRQFYGMFDTPLEASPPAASQRRSAGAQGYAAFVIGRSGSPSSKEYYM
jgi:hypothetical protein